MVGLTLTIIIGCYTGIECHQMTTVSQVVMQSVHTRHQSSINNVRTRTSRRVQSLHDDENNVI